MYTSYLLIFSKNKLFLIKYKTLRKENTKLQNITHRSAQLLDLSIKSFLQTFIPANIGKSETQVFSEQSQEFKNFSYEIKVNLGIYKDTRG